jgi:hypothetical protein
MFGNTAVVEVTERSHENIINTNFPRLILEIPEGIKKYKTNIITKIGKPLRSYNEGSADYLLTFNIRGEYVNVSFLTWRDYKELITLPFAHEFNMLLEYGGNIYSGDMLYAFIVQSNQLD